jgi:hypothetical protein
MVLGIYNKECGKNLPLQSPSLRARFVGAAIRWKNFYRLPLVCRKFMVEVLFMRNFWAWMGFSLSHRLGRRE